MSTQGEAIAALDIQRQTGREVARRDWRQGEAIDGGEAWARVERARQYGDTASEVYWLAYRETVIALCEERERRARLGECATPGCERTARWYSVPEGNRYGNQAPRRCVECCDKIRDAHAITDEEIARVLTGPAVYVVVDGNAYSLTATVELLHAPLAADGTPVWGDSALVDPRAMDREHMREIRDGIGALTEAVRRIHGYA